MERQLSNHNLNLGLKATTVGIKAISTLFSLCGLLLSGNSTVDQVIPDNTLPTNSVTLPNGNLIVPEIRRTVITIILEIHCKDVVSSG